MTKTEALEKARAARTYYATPEGRRERLAEHEAKLAELGAQIDALRESGEPIPWRLREQAQDAAHRITAIKAAILSE